MVRSSQVEFPCEEALYIYEPNGDHDLAEFGFKAADFTPLDYAVHVVPGVAVKPPEFVTDGVVPFGVFVTPLHKIPQLVLHINGYESHQHAMDKTVGIHVATNQVAGPSTQLRTILFSSKKAWDEHPDIHAQALSLTALDDLHDPVFKPLFRDSIGFWALNDTQKEMFNFWVEQLIEVENLSVEEALIRLDPMLKFGYNQAIQRTDLFLVGWPEDLYTPEDIEFFDMLNTEFECYDFGSWEV